MDNNSECRSIFFVEKDNECSRDSELVELCEIAETTYYVSEFFKKEFVDTETKHEAEFDSKFDKILYDIAEEAESKAMDTYEDSESDSTVKITDLPENPEKIARKRRKLDALIRKISTASTHVAGDVENTAPDFPSANLPIDRKQYCNNDPETTQWRLNKFLGDCDHPVDSNNDSMVEDLKVKEELLKQENDSQKREGSYAKEVKEDFVVISDDSDDDCTIVTDDTNRQVDKNTNLNSRIGVLTPSAINTRRATLDSFETNETTSNISGSVMPTNASKVNPRLTVLKASAINSRRATFDSFARNEATSNNINFPSNEIKKKEGNDNNKLIPNANKVNPRLTVLKPSAINSRRATFNSFERNEATSNNIIFSSKEIKNKEGNDNNKAKEATNKHVNKTTGLSGYKSYDKHPPKLTTPNQNVISRKRNSNGAIQGKPANLQAENIILSSKNKDINIKEIAAVIAKRNKSTDSSSAIHSKADVLAINVQEMSENQERVDTGVVSSNDANKTDTNHDKTVQKNTVDNVCKNVTVTKNNNINNSFNGDVNQSEDAGNRVKDQTANSGKIPVDIGVFDGSKKENGNLTIGYETTDAKRIAVDRHALKNNVSCSSVVSNINSVENPILQELKNIIKQNIVQEEHTGVLDDIAKVNEQLSNVSKSGKTSPNRAKIQTPNKDVLCSSNVSHDNSSKNHVINALKKVFKENEVYQTETGKCSKSDEKFTKLNYEQSKRGEDHDQEINLNQIAEVDNRGKEICCDKEHKRVTQFLISFFKNVKEYLKEICQYSELASKLRESSRTLKREIKHILNDAKKHGASEVRYACPKCSQVSVYSPEAMYQIGDNNNAILKHITLKCKLCCGLQMLHNTQMQIYLQNISDKNNDEINTPERRQESTSKLPSTENNNVAININNSAPITSIAGTSKPNMSATTNKNEDTNVVDNLTAKSLVKTAASANNDVLTKTSQNRNKNRTTSNENSQQRYPTVCNENDEITSGNDKTKSFKRTIDDNRSPINPKRVRTDITTRDESTKVVKGNCYQTEPSSTTDIPSSLHNEPAKLNNAGSQIISNIETTWNREGRPRDYYETASRENNKAQLTQTLVGCFTKFQTRENYENTETANVHTCPVLVCSNIFDSHTSLIEHMRDSHNMPQNLITCPLCNSHLNETNYMAHVKVHFPDENTEVVGNETATEISNVNRNLNTTDANTQQQNTAKVAKSSEGKQYECKICKELLYSLNATKKHRKRVHGHLDLKNKKLFIVTEKKGFGLNSVHSQSSARLENAVSEDRNTTFGDREEIANLETVSLGSYEMTKYEESGKSEINKDAAKTRDFVEKGSDYKQNLNNNKNQINVTQNCDENIDNQKKPNQERKRKANNDNIDIIQEAKQANMIKSCPKNKKEELENEDNSSRSHTIDEAQNTTKTDIVTKLHEPSRNVDSVKQSHKARDSENIPANVEMISEPLILHGSNTQGDISTVAESNSQSEVDETGKVAVTNDINMYITEDSHKTSVFKDVYPENNSVGESNKLPDANISQNVDHTIYTQVEDEISREQNKSQCIFPTKSGGKPTLVNCYNCLSNIDVNDMNNHDCRQKIVGTLYNCYSCGVSVLHDDTHKCEKENNNCIENIQITKIVTVKEVYVFKCEDCHFATDVYDHVIRHCQNHYNEIKDPIASCETCQLSYNINSFKTHKNLHEKDLKIISYSYKSLFSNWDKTFESMPSDVVEEMQARSIYTSHCVKMRILTEGPWQYTLYQCNQCETCVPPGKVDQHCRRQCYYVAYPCSVCGKLFTSYTMCAHHELDHKTTKLFKIIEFNCKKDEHFNFKLFGARKIEMESRIPIADIFKCLCGLCFISNESFKNHFIVCNSEDKGVMCSRCVAPRLFDENELENHLRLHHSTVGYRFRVNTIVIQQEIETFEVLDRDTSKVEDDVKREWLEEETNERTV